MAAYFHCQIFYAYSRILTLNKPDQYYRFCGFSTHLSESIGRLSIFTPNKPRMAHPKASEENLNSVSSDITPKAVLGATSSVPTVDFSIVHGRVPNGAKVTQQVSVGQPLMLTWTIDEASSKSSNTQRRLLQTYESVRPFDCVCVRPSARN